MLQRNFILYRNSKTFKFSASQSAKYSKILICFICTSMLLVAATLIVASTNLNWEYKLKIITLFSVISLLLSFYYHLKLSHKLFDLINIFLIILYLFHFGQYILYLFNIYYKFFWEVPNYLNAFEANYNIIIKAVILSNCYFLVFAICTNIPQYFKNIRFFKNNIKTFGNIQRKNILKFALILFIISVIPTLIVRVKEIIISVSDGYANSLNENICSILKLLESLFIPSLFLMYFSTNKKWVKYTILCSFILYSLILFIIGGRTECVALIVTALILFLRNKKIKLKFIILSIISLLVLLVLIVATAEYRNVSNKTLSSFIDCTINIIKTNSIFAQFIGEMGWTGSTFCYVISITNTEGFIWGTSYFNSLLNIIPSSLDILGIVNTYGSQAFLSSWLTQKVGFAFGTGSSLFAEAYLNFGGLLGIVPIGFIGYLIGSFLSIDSFKTTANNIFDYIKFYIFYSLFTLPRREFVYLIDQLSNFILIILLALYLFNYIYNKIELNKKIKDN